MVLICTSIYVPDIVLNAVREKCRVCAEEDYNNLSWNRENEEVRSLFFLSNFLRANSVVFYLNGENPL